jgi:light-harvesting complex 1 beta chain
MEGRITSPGTVITEVRNQTGLNDDEARAFHGYFITGFLGFTAVAAVAHFLAWQWRPWF